MTNYRKKLIEVALPLEAINKASAREKSIRHGHPSTLHLWWARRPLAAARAVIFAQMVDDPSCYVDTLKSDPKLRRQAEALLKGRHKRWVEAKALFEKAHKAGISAPEPGAEPNLNDILAEVERQRLFKIIEDLVPWENNTNETVLQTARDEIWQSWRRTCVENVEHPRAKELFDRKKLPAFHDPFAGGGALPLEAQRLGLESNASDLNPVAVLINKAMIELPPRFSGRPPINPDARNGKLDIKTWKGAQGLAHDVQYYGKWMHDEAEKRVGHLYPKIEITADMAKERPDLTPLLGQKLTVIAWLWARTVKSPNPAFRQVDVPLASTFMLSTKSGKERYVHPVLEDGGYHFTVKVGKPNNPEAVKVGTKLARGANFQCIMSGAPIPSEHIYSEAKAGRMGSRLMAVVAEGQRGRIYIEPTPEHEKAALNAKPGWKPDLLMPANPRWFSPPLYGLATYGDLFTPRQLVVLTTLCDLVGDVNALIKKDALDAGLANDDRPLREGGTGVRGYAEAVSTYLGQAASKMTSYHCTLGVWRANMDKSGRAFGRQALPMVWDYPECNPFAGAGGDWRGACQDASKVIASLGNGPTGHAYQSAAQFNLNQTPLFPVISTDPPYYDNIGYADLSDFFYVWLRRSIKAIFPDLFSTLATPKAEELVATPYRHGSKEGAEKFFLEGMSAAMHRLSQETREGFPITIYYAFKQSEYGGENNTVSTGWETFLDAVVRAGLSISGTWPIRTEQSAALKATINSLASSIILVCRSRLAEAPSVLRAQFLAELRRELPEALRHLQAGNIAPVDLAQAAIGPGMAVYTRYTKVLDAQGKALSVREALALINETLDSALSEQEGDFDADSRWAVAWFEQYGFGEGEFGVAETLSKAKVTSVDGLVEAGILDSKRGKVRLLKPDELPNDWDPKTDKRLTGWETVHHLIRVLTSGGESAAAELVAKLGVKAEPARELAYRLYTICERKKRAAEALAYNGLVQSWPELIRLSQQESLAQPVEKQETLFEE